LKKYFGTDGIRGIPNQNLNLELVRNIFSAVEKELNPVSVAVILDTRSSSNEILNWITSGLSEAVQVINYGVLPSGSMPIILKEFGHDLGVIISASHNPSEYNGIKLINKDGSKFSDELEVKIEQTSEKIEPPEASTKFKDSNLGYEAYLNFLKTELNFDLGNFNLVIDAANGSAYKIVDELFSIKNSKYKLIANSPDGLNINENSGATHLNFLSDVLKNGELGAAFDGDADRLIMVDEEGEICNGDVIILLIAKYFSSINQLKNNIVVSTVMSNFGFKQSMQANNFNNIETNVGDKYVAESLLLNNASIGGEQSGHIIIPDVLPVGDGLLTLIYCLKALTFFNTTLSQFKNSNIKEYPQKLVNLKLESLATTEQLDELKIIAEQLAEESSLDGRHLIRNSGTEPVLRILVEAKTDQELDEFMTKLTKKIESYLNS
jgi:phosphoglucosamine mutase